jgi:hypothetical protein
MGTDRVDRNNGGAKALGFSIVEVEGHNLPRLHRAGLRKDKWYERQSARILIATSLESSRPAAAERVRS